MNNFEKNGKKLETFGKHLSRFAKAVDIVSESSYLSLREEIQKYLKNRFSIEFIELLVPSTVNDAPGLKSNWQEGGKSWSMSIKNSDGEYNGQISYAWHLRKSMWIVAKSGCELANTDQYQDLLNPNNNKKIPKYVDLVNEHPIKTSIMFILYHDDEAFGILNLESSRYLRANELLKEEIKCIVESFSLLYNLHKNNKIQSNNTKLALDSLKSFNYLPITILPKVFVASSSEADKKVTGCIAKVLTQFDIEVDYWKVNKRDGNIIDQIWENIYTSDIGICYFSEPSSNPDYKYQDNNNVLFEAGMIHALSKSSNDVMFGWFPIRERNSPKVPFDFHTERILIVPRNKEDQLSADEFEADLEDRLDWAGIPRRVKP